MLRIFKLKEHGSDVKTEALAGFTTFLTMMYIIPVNAIIMSQTGMPMDALITATALITIFSTLLTGIYANTPVAMSVGMGLNAYFTFGLVLGMKIPWQEALGVVFVSGFLFLIVSFTSFRRWIIESIPKDLRRAISAGIGAFIAFIGLKQMGVIVNNETTLVSLGNLSDVNVFLGIAGLLIVLTLSSWRTKGAFIISIAITSIIGWILGLKAMPEAIFSLPASIAPIAMKLDILSVFTLSMLPVILAFMITDMFDSIGTLAGVGYRAGIFSDGDSEKLEKTLQVDAAATVGGSLLGLSTTTSFLESASGVEEGGRTGLTAVFTALFFVLTLFMLPLFSAIPDNAIYPVLVAVGILMFSELRHIDFSDFSVSVAVFAIVLLMPLTYSITNGLAAGLVLYFFMRLIRREWNEISGGLIFLVAISMIPFVFQA
ncbi:MAG: NCS2 family permease [Wolinella sp.]